MVRAVVIALAGIGCLWGGVPALTLALTNWTPLETSCGTFDPRTTSARWLRLTDCDAYFADAAYTTVGRTVTEVYLPVWSSDASKDARSALVLASRRPEHIAFGEALIASQGDPDAMQRALDTHRDALRVRGDITGMVRSEGGLSASEREQLSGLARVLRPDFVVMDDGSTPDPRLGGGLTLAGLVFLVLSAGLVRRRRGLPNQPDSDERTGGGRVPSQVDEPL